MLPSSITPPPLLTFGVDFRPLWSHSAVSPTVFILVQCSKVWINHCHCQSSQWRSKALRGPGSTVTWDPPFPSPPLPPLFPSLLPSSSPAQPLPLRRSGPQIQLEGLGSAVWSGTEPQPKLNLGHFSLKIRHLVATILMIFLRALPKIFLWPHYSGPQEFGGPGSLNCLNPRSA